MNRRTYTPGARRIAPKWFTDGTSHTDAADAILDRIDEERAESRIVTLIDRCVLCNENKSVTLVRNKLVCKPCRKGIVEPLLDINSAQGPTARKRLKRGGPYYIKLPHEEKPRLVFAPTASIARRDLAERIGCSRLPQGTRVWTA